MTTQPARSPAIVSFIKRRLSPWRLWRDQRGGIAITAAIMMPVLIGTVGLGVEVSSWGAESLKLQRIADNSALAAAKVLNSGASTYLAETAAINLAEINGVAATARTWSAGTNTLSNTNVTVKLVSGVRVASDQAFQVTVTRSVGLMLAKMFITNASTVPLKATAYAELIQAAIGSVQPCIVGLAHEATPGTLVGLSVSGNSPLNSGNCALQANADVAITGGDHVTASAVYSGGNVLVNGSSSITAPNGVFSAANVTASGSGVITANTSASANITVSGGGLIVGTVAAGGNISMQSGTITGNIGSTGTTTVDGASTLNGNVTANAISVPNGTINGNTVSASADSINQYSGVVTGTKSIGGAPAAPTSPGTIADPYGSNSTVQSALGQLGSGGSALNIGWAANPVVIQPGTYSSITTSDYATFSNATAVTFAPGTYYVNGNINLQGYVAGTGVTIVASGTVQIGAGTVALSAPLAGASSGIPGMLLIGKTSSAFTLISSGNAANLAGVMYFPNAPLSITGGVTATAAGCLELIASTVTIGGGSTVGGNCSSFGASTFSGTAPITYVALVK